MIGQVARNKRQRAAQRVTEQRFPRAVRPQNTPMFSLPKAPRRAVENEPLPQPEGGVSQGRGCGGSNVNRKSQT